MPTQQALLYARHVAHRKEQFDRVLSELGYDRLLIHSGRPEMRLYDDQHPAFRAHAPFVAWVPQPRAVDGLIEIRVGEQPLLWFCQPRDYWHLPPERPADWWAQAYDLRIVDSPEAWRDRFRGHGVTAVLGRRRDLGDWVDAADLNPSRLIARLDELRTVKTAWERDCIAEANRTAARAHQAAVAAFEGGASELQIHLAYLAAAGQDQDQLPYNNIVALNEHAAVLHYQWRSPQRPRNSRSFLIDAGADHFGYAADITRTTTLPEHSDFDDLIDLLDRAQQKLVGAVRAGQSFPELHRRAHLAVAAILEQAGIVRMTPESMVETGVSACFLPHGLGHFLGVQVHDVAGQRAPSGEPLPPPPAWPALRLTRVLEPGNVLTVEPGLYFIPMLLDELRSGPHRQAVDWAAVERLLPFGGIRVEDNVLVTEGDPINYSREAFAALA